MTKRAITLTPGPTFETESPRRPVDSPDMALKELQDGNQRFVAGQMRHPGHTPQSRQQLPHYQQRFAVILTCSDSRVPPEIKARPTRMAAYRPRLKGPAACEADREIRTETFVLVKLDELDPS